MILKYAIRLIYNLKDAFKGFTKLSQKHISKRGLKKIVQPRGCASTVCVYLGNNKALTKTIWGQKIFVDTRDVSLTPHILVDGYWEMWITNVLLNVLKEGMTVVEVGANVGYYTLLVASKIGKHGKCFAFEANPEIFELLFRNVEVNGFLDRVILVNKAVANRTGWLKFHKYHRHMGSSSITLPDRRTLENILDDIEMIDVEVVSLDDYFSGKSVTIDILKMDAEGSEPLILKGARELLRCNSNLIIIMEWAPSLMRAVGEEPNLFLDFFSQQGFTLRYIDANSYIRDIDEQSLLAMPHCELFLTRQKDLSRVINC